MGRAADASLLVATLEVREGRTYLVGEMRWAALYASLLITLVAPTLMGFALMAWALVDGPWFVAAGAALFSVSLGWMSWLSLRSIEEDQELEQGLLEEELRRLLS